MMKFKVEIGNIGVTNEHLNLVVHGQMVTKPEMYAYDEIRKGVRSKYTLAFYDVNVEKGEVELRFIGKRPFKDTINAEHFMYLANLGYELITFALENDISLQAKEE